MFKHTMTLRLEDKSRLRITLRMNARTTRTNTRTVIHDPAPTGIVHVSFTGEVIEYRHREPYTGGQVIMSHRDDMPPAVAAAWDRWHLNDMRSHCAHQDRAIPWDSVPPCEETGYRAGTAWLVEPLTVDGAGQCIAAVGGSAHVFAKDGVVVEVTGTGIDPLVTMHRLQGQSMDYALANGWEVRTVG